jgi:hypothetical protein
MVLREGVQFALREKGSKSIGDTLLMTVIKSVLDFELGKLSTPRRLSYALS